MQLEAGDYFAVVRGMKLHDHVMALDLPGLLTGKTNATKEDRYDRSDEGCIFLALEVCGSMVAALCVGTTLTWHKDAVGRSFSMNTTDIEVMTLTSKYVSAALANSPVPHVIPKCAPARETTKGSES